MVSGFRATSQAARAGASRRRWGAGGADHCISSLTLTRPAAAA